MNLKQRSSIHGLWEVVYACSTLFIYFRLLYFSSYSSSTFSILSIAPPWLLVFFCLNNTVNLSCSIHHLCNSLVLVYSNMIQGCLWLFPFNLLNLGPFLTGFRALSQCLPPPPPLVLQLLLLWLVLQCCPLIQPFVATGIYPCKGSCCHSVLHRLERLVWSWG